MATDDALTVRAALAPNGPLRPWPLRVSRMRVGVVRGVKRSPNAESASWMPTTSTTTCTEPLLVFETRKPAPCVECPALTTTMFGAMTPGS